MYKRLARSHSHQRSADNWSSAHLSIVHRSSLPQPVLHTSDVCSYVAQMAGELGAIAHSRGYERLAFLFDCIVIVARSEERRVSPVKQSSRLSAVPASAP